MTIRLHHVPFTRSFRILWLLEELGLSCEVVPHTIQGGDLRTTEFRAISPGARVPALEIDGITIYESAAIVQYLCESREGHGLMPEKGIERVRFLEWLGFTETQASILTNLNLQYLFMPPETKLCADVLRLEAARLGSSLKTLDGVLQQQDWLLKSGFSAADTMMGFNLFAAPYYVKMDRFDAVRAYVERIEARPAYQAARKKDGPQKLYSKDFYEASEAGS